jgi:hypothetical protein
MTKENIKKIEKATTNFSYRRTQLYNYKGQLPYCAISQVLTQRWNSILNLKMW